MNSEVTRLRNGKSPRSAAVLPLGILFAMLGIAATVVIWLSLTGEHAQIDATGIGPKAVGDLPSADKNTKPRDHEPIKGNGHSDEKPAQDTKQTHTTMASGALTPPSHVTSPHGTLAPEASTRTTETHGAVDAAHQTPSQAIDHEKPTDHAKAKTETPSAPPQIVVAPIDKIVAEKVPGQLQLPIVRSRQPLSPAPAAGLVQMSGLGSLPIISTDGRQPWKIYARPFDKSNKKPRIALVITGLGLSSAATNIAIQSLPGTITLAFAPYAERLDDWIRLARTAGHEVLLNVPMEPVNYPEYDPGPQTLLTSLPPQENVERLLWTLSRATGYVGVVDFMGSRFATSRKHLRPILKMLKKRGLMYMDSKSASRSLAPVLADDIEIPFVINSQFIDEQASRFAIDKQLEFLEATAKKNKMAIGMGSPYPVTLERISHWVKKLGERGFVLAPISAMVK